MNLLLKKPYEISLWDEDLIWRRQRLQLVEGLLEEDYKPGKYYSSNLQDIQGVKPYALDFGEWMEGRAYYAPKNDSDEDYFEDTNADGVGIDPTTDKEWYSFALTKDTEENDEKSYYIKIGEGWVKASGIFDNTTWYEATPLPFVIIQYYKERKICTIGSDTMDTPVRATSAKLVSNVNGSNTLSFNMYSRYYDEEAGDFYDNPFRKLLVNERKLKLRYGALNTVDCKWYDFVIKDIKENSENKTFSYTCKDLFINELSKTGFNLVLDPELENNMGNITYLADKILEESDWRRGQDNDVLAQVKEEPLYRYVLNTTILVKNMKTNEEISIPVDSVIYGFYGVVANEEPYFQFLYREDGLYKTDDDRVILNSENYYKENVTYVDGRPSFVREEYALSKEYRGNKLVRQALTEFDAKLDRYVNVYTDEHGNKRRGYVKTEYITPTAVSSYITNGEGIASITGWEVGAYWESGDKNKEIFPELSLVGFPDARDVEWTDDTEFHSYLKYVQNDPQATKEQYLYNSGFADHRSKIEKLSVGEKYVLRAKICEAEATNSAGRPTAMKLTTKGNSIKFCIGTYTLDHGKYSITEKFFEGWFYEAADEDGWIYAKSSGSPYGQIISTVSKSYSDLINNRIGIFFQLTDYGQKTPFYFEEVQLYKFIEYERLKADSTDEWETVSAEPGGELFSAARKKYIYYDPLQMYEKPEDLKPEYEDYEDSDKYTLVYNDNQFEKVRSITAKESNRFNLIQDLCETFECWAKFEVEHNLSTGEILLDEDFRQKKWVTFHEYIGRDNYVGFRYGVNLKSISRTLNSDGIVSKIIVKDNSNEFAPNGFCSIARAMENPSGENFILNFNHYVHQGLMKATEIDNDLYIETNGYLGYYKKLRRLNDLREARIEEWAQSSTDLAQYEADYQTYKISVEEANELLRTAKQEIKTLTTMTFDQLCQAKTDPWWDDEGVIQRVTSIAQLNAKIASHSDKRDKALARKTAKEAEQALYEDWIDELAEQKRALNFQFYKKYSRFIQEGSWISEDYVDDNLYYLDAESTLHTSAQPKVTYTINVLELSQVEGYENYRFALGDKTYIEDTEFFGWVYKNGMRTPYHEEIVISEFTVELDSPEKNTFKVQNFKTQFEDLFQRITATTQAVEYHTGEYGRAAGIVEADGTISVSTLQNSFANNAIRLENARDQSVVWDETGITTTSLANPSEIVRLVSGGLFVSSDGGTTWTAGVTGAGINANFLTAGQIDASKIHILAGDFPSFRWDARGISAYEFSISETTGLPSAFRASKFVRYDQYGLYGINGIENFVANSEEHIWNNAHFALTWKGFMLKNAYGSGYVSIDSKNDFSVFDGNGYRRIWLGNINENTSDRYSRPIYGLSIANAMGQPVMVTDHYGELWLESSLRVGTTSTSTVEIGYLRDKVDPSNENIHEVIHAGDQGTEFIVYEDGRMKATGAEFTGTIIAEGSKIGNMTIESVEAAVGKVPELIETSRKLDISSKLGYTFNVGSDGAVAPDEPLHFVAKAQGFEPEQDKLAWYGSNDFENWRLLDRGLNCYLSYGDLMSLEERERPINGVYYVQLRYNNGQYQSDKRIDIINNGKDGKDGTSPIMLQITNKRGTMYINGELQAELIATVSQDNEDISDRFLSTQFTWIKYDDENEDGVVVGTGRTLQVDETMVNKKANFVCDLTF